MLCYNVFIQNRAVHYGYYSSVCLCSRYTGWAKNWIISEVSYSCIW